ncbi:MAG: CTP synthetase [Rickettsiales bacterium]|nr:CTP synthetase [Rickettsiales bacterium]|tara:strand:+ start:266 stop:1900 length:1635 start_codon:yes stop_codon:yes gene_type:complete
MTKFIFITGGVVSSLGKGIASSSIASLLQLANFKVRVRKLDPYLNMDPGTMNPAQHGEVFVTDDGAETDMDLGHYERFTGITSKKSDSITTGKIYSEVLKKERRGDYLGATVQVIPHVTEEIKNFIKADTIKEDFVICEIGGTVGDIESLPFLEAIRQLRNELGRKRTCFIHLTLLPFVSSAKEFKTKPTQHSVKELLSSGIQPDILICRTVKKFDISSKKKISLFCNIPMESVIMAIDVNSIYEVPITLHSEKIDDRIFDHFSITKKKKINLSVWKNFKKRTEKIKNDVNLAIVGKYLNVTESYKSLYEAIFHSGVKNNVKINISWIDSVKLKNQKICKNILSKFDGILVPGGFGKRGVDGKINSITFAKENKIPFLGICFGMQLAVIEAIRNIKGYETASSSEFNRNSDNVITFMDEWVEKSQIHKQDKENLGGSMRLGSYKSILKNNTKIHQIYKSKQIHERHRHRYEVNYKLKSVIESCGVIFSGMSPDGKLAEVMEYDDHPWFIGVQFHPELKSSPFSPHPLFNSFINALTDRGVLNEK